MTDVKRLFVQYAIRIYRRSPFHPHWTPRLAKVLGRWDKGRRKQGMRVHDLGRFKIHIDLSQFIDSQLYYVGSYEPDTVRTIEELVGPGDVAFDVGANIGYMTLNLASRVGQAGKVIAFEPSSWAFHRLQENIRLNDIHQIEACRLGVGEVTREGVKLMLPQGYRLDGRVTAIEELVDICTLDGYVTEHGITRLDFLKIDTDGMEAAIIRGAYETLARFRPKMIFEFAPWHLGTRGETPEDLLGRLLDLGYSFFHPGTLQPLDHMEQIVAELSGSRTVNVVALPA